MRGEETQLVGIQSIRAGKWMPNEHTLVILPGTHSKHVEISDRKAVAFKTYMTGELFCLLFTNSILAQSVTPNDFSTHGCLESFCEGVQLGLRENILHALFDVRIRGMFHQADTRVNFAYMSGQMIGAELRDLSSRQINQLVICGSELMNEAYAMALDQLAWQGGKPHVDCIPAAAATAAGQLMMYKSRGLSKFTL
jgi:2-dehydro-3-deoxygalactonokinase